MPCRVSRYARGGQWKRHVIPDSCRWSNFAGRISAAAEDSRDRALEEVLGYCATEDSVLPLVYQEPSSPVGPWTVAVAELGRRQYEL